MYQCSARADRDQSQLRHPGGNRRHQSENRAAGKAMLTSLGVAHQDIFRKYPNKYESIIGTLCESLDRLDEPEAKASMIWIIGEYAERIDNADELLDTFLETFPDETSVVQLQLLTSSVKLFLKKPTELAQQMISKVLSAATSEADNPDLRDRAFVYWRLLSTDPEVRRVVRRVSCSSQVSLGSKGHRALTETDHLG